MSEHNKDKKEDKQGLFGLDEFVTAMIDTNVSVGGSKVGEVKERVHINTEKEDEE